MSSPRLAENLGAELEIFTSQSITLPAEPVPELFCAVEIAEVNNNPDNDLAKALESKKSEDANSKVATEELKSFEDLLTLSMQDFHLKNQPEIYAPKISFRLESNEELVFGPVSIPFLFNL